MNSPHPQEEASHSDASRAERRFLVYNRTDGIIAHPALMTLAEATEFIRRFSARFDRQGYYLTASRDRVPAGTVELQIVDEGLNPVLPDEIASGHSYQR
mgnify:FL=1